MADSLRNIGSILVEYQVIQDPSPLISASTSLLRISNSSKKKDINKWSYVIHPCAPLEFKAVEIKYLNAFVKPRIYSTIEINSERLDKGLPPFSRLDCALEVLNEIDNRLLLRTHIDLANQDGIRIQDGPLHHIQFGGHQPDGNRALEIAVKEPRWLHPPLDLILLCEVVVANFYPNEWEEIKKDSRWCDLIVDSQKMCLDPFYKHILNFLSISSRTVLEQSWAKNWCA